MPVTLILGGARSGKSTRAEALASNTCLNVCYIATAPKFEDDNEWQQRISKHQQQRPTSWTTIEEEIDLLNIIRQQSSPESCVLVDCLCLWLSNLMFKQCDIDDKVEQLCLMLHQQEHEIILVSNEVGMGLVPENKLGREFRDALGLLNQSVAKVAHRVEFIAAGLPLLLKP